MGGRRKSLCHAQLAGPTLKRVNAIMLLVIPGNGFSLSRSVRFKWHHPRLARKITEGREAERRSRSCFSTALQNSVLHFARRGNSRLLAPLPQQRDAKPAGKISAQPSEKEKQTGCQRKNKIIWQNWMTPENKKALPEGPELDLHGSCALRGVWALVLAVVSLPFSCSYTSC